MSNNSSSDTGGKSQQEHVSDLLSGFVDGELEPLATAIHPEVEEDLYPLLNPEVDDSLLEDPLTALQRVRRAMVAQSGEPSTIDVTGLEPENDSWDLDRYCGDETAPERFEATIECQHGTHHLGLGLADEDVVGFAFLDEYSPPANVEPDSFTQQEVTFENDGLEFGGTLTLPATQDTLACAILVSGASPLDRNYEEGAQQFLKDVAWGLAERGIASYRYDKRSYATDATDIDKSAVSLDWPTVDDTLSATHAIAEHPAIDENRLFLTGHSRGGMLAPRIAQRYSRYRGVVILDGYAQSYPDYFVDLYDEYGKLDWITERERTAISTVSSPIEDFLAGNLDPDTDELLGLSLEYARERSRYDKTGTAGSLKSPVLVLQAGGDLPTFKQQSADLWRNSLNQPASKVVFFSAYNHYLQQTHGQSVGLEPLLFHDNVASPVIDETAEWIHGVV